MCILRSPKKGQTKFIDLNVQNVLNPSRSRAPPALSMLHFAKASQMFDPSLLHLFPRLAKTTKEVRKPPESISYYSHLRPSFLSV